VESRRLWVKGVVEIVEMGWVTGLAGRDECREALG
jgi:hypothetical protein